MIFVNEICNAVICAVTWICCFPFIKDFMKFVFTNYTKESDDLFFLPNGKRYKLSDCWATLYSVLDATIFVLVLAMTILTIFCFVYRNSEYYYFIASLCDKMCVILGVTSLLSLREKCMRKVCAKSISLDDMLLWENPEDLKRFLISRKRILIHCEEMELNNKFYKDMTLCWIQNNGFNRVNIAICENERDKR